MKKNLTFSLCVLMAMFSLFSCQHEENETTISEEEALSKSAPVTTLLQRISMVDVSSDNIIDSTDCFKVKLPVDVLVNNQPVHIDSEEDFAIVQQILDTTDPIQESIAFVFPVTVIFADGEEATIQSQEVMDGIIADCEFGYPNPEPIGCITINYPITIFGYNANFQLASTHVIQNNQQLFALLFNLQGNQFYSIDFPISMTNVNGEIITVNNNAELQVAITENVCAPIDPVDPCFNPHILTDGLIVYMPFANEAHDLVSANEVITTPNYPPVFVADRNGNPHSAVSFGGNSYDYYKVLSTTENMIEQSDSLSVSLWFKMQNVNQGNLERFFEKGRVEENFSMYGLGVYDLNKPFFYSNHLAQFNLWDTAWGTNPALPTDTTNWHHLVITVTSEPTAMSVVNNVKLYRDGVLVATGQTESMFINAQDGDYLFGRGFQGHLDDVRIYRRVLTPANVQTLYQLEGDNNTCLSN